MTQSPGVSAKSLTAELPFGSTVRPDGRVRFNLWAPSAKQVELILLSSDNREMVVPLPKDREGWCSIVTDEAAHGTRYQYRINNDLLVPDPASRFQPDDVHGSSMVIDPARFIWNDHSWQGRPWHEAVIYELHVGTFTPEGTFKAVKKKLDYLHDLGVTAIELMPVSDFPGKRNWGYDGVLPYAPDSSYGTPDDLRSLVQAAHAKNIMVMLDVVYNHFGPEGNYLHAYAEPFFTERHKTPWGAGINFDGPDSRFVRQFFTANVLYWLNEFHFDGLRLDAVNTIRDDSAKHVLVEIAEAVNAGPRRDRHIHLILENDDNNANLLARDAHGHPKLYNAQWNDDIHHALHVVATGEKDGYYADYAEKTSANDGIGHLARCLTEGFAYQDDPSPYRHGERRGQISKHLPPTAFVSFMQNHDQIGNRAFGERINVLASQPIAAAASSILFMCPHIPMFFMGEEWGSLSPFFFFCDLGPDLAPLVTEGRRSEFAKFAQFQDPRKREAIPDPVSEATFHKSRLDWSDLEKEDHRNCLKLHKELLQLRQEYVVPLLAGSDKPPRVRVGLPEQGLLSAEWTFKGETTLRLVANLSAAPVSSSEIKQPAGTKMIFDSSSTAANSADTLLPPWSVRWFLQNDPA